MASAAPTFCSLAPLSRSSFFSIACPLSHGVYPFLSPLPLLIFDQRASSAWWVPNYPGWLLLSGLFGGSREVEVAQEAGVRIPQPPAVDQSFALGAFPF